MLACIGIRIFAKYFWLAKRKRALLENNPPGITNRSLIKSMGEGVVAGSRPFNCLAESILRDLIDLPMPQKTHVRALATLAIARPRSNSAGGT
jgi:hypothetical protein